MKVRGRGRPPHDWLPEGTPVEITGVYAFELRAHRPLIRGRVMAVEDGRYVAIYTPDNHEVWVDLRRVKRYRKVDGLFSPDDRVVITETGEPVIVDGYEENGEVRVRRFRLPDLVVAESSLELFK